MRLLALIGALAIIAAIGGAIYFFGGYYNVAASEEDSGVVVWALTHIRNASIEKHAVEPPPSLDDPALIKAGARAFAERGCVNCHGAPGVNWAKFSEGLRPDPPELKDVAKELPPEQIFWVIKNGIKMSGMPSFGAIKTGDPEMWAIAAFVKKLPNVSPEDYKAWSAGASGAAPAAEKR